MQLRVLTLNAWALAPPLSRDTALRMRAIGSALAALELDIAAFQECWHAPSRAALVEASAGSGLEHVWHPQQALQGSGLLVLSRWPIARAKLHRFSLRGVAEWLDEADYIGHKGFCELALDTPAGLLTLVDTHLQAAYAPRARDPHVAIRVGQALQLAARLRAIEGPLILAGDLNFEEDQQEYRVLTGVGGVTDAAAALGRRQDTIVPGNPYSRGDQRGERIDYLFCRNGARRLLVPTSIMRALDGPISDAGERGSYSDHAGLLGEFELREGAGALPPIEHASLHGVRPLLEAGRQEAVTRQQRQRVVGSLGLAMFPAAAMLARRPALSRRRFLRAAVLWAGSLAGLFGVARLGLTASLRPQELEGFDSALATLASLEG